MIPLVFLMRLNRPGAVRVFPAARIEFYLCSIFDASNSTTVVAPVAIENGAQ